MAWSNQKMSWKPKLYINTFTDIDTYVGCSPYKCAFNGKGFANACNQMKSRAQDAWQNAAWLLFILQDLQIGPSASPPPSITQSTWRKFQPSEMKIDGFSAFVTPSCSTSSCHPPGGANKSQKYLVNGNGTCSPQKFPANLHLIWQVGVDVLGKTFQAHISSLSLTEWYQQGSHLTGAREKHEFIPLEPLDTLAN